MVAKPMGLRAGMQSVLDLVYGRYCLTCDTPVVTEDALCPDCWRDTPFIHGLVCDKCGVPLPGQDAGTPEYCDDCLSIARPWDRGRAGLLYKDNGRKIVLTLKHGDRPDLARPTADWMVRSAAPLIVPDMIVAPIPLHRFRLLRRLYNQSAMLSSRVASRLGLAHCPDLLRRTRYTGSQDGRDRDGRFANLAGALAVTPRHRARMSGAHVLLVDDVMTSGATFAAAAEVCHASGARAVSVLTLARVAKDA